MSCSLGIYIHSDDKNKHISETGNDHTHYPPPDHKILLTHGRGGAMAQSSIAVCDANVS